MTGGRGPYPVHPFAQVLQINFPSQAGITKLDFVNHRYMVRGKSQLFADVLGDDLPNGFGGFTRTGAEQRSWRTAEGLDLRKYNEFGLQVGSNQAFLTNKTATPDYSSNPGALNEFLFLDYVMVMEFDWFDVPGIINEQTGGGFPQGIDVVYWIFANRNNANNQYFVLSNTEMMQEGTGDLSAANGSWDWPQIDDTHWGPPTLFLPPGTDPGFTPPAPIQGTIGEIIERLPGEPPPYPEVFSVPGAWDSEPYTMVPYLTTYDTTGGATPIDGRMIGGHPDEINNSTSPMNTGALSAPYGRVRVAMRVKSTTLQVSVNGGGLMTVNQAALGVVPRVPPFGLSYFPNNGTGFQKDYEVAFDFSGIVRCVWLMRARTTKEANRFNALNLRTMSVVQPLPLSDSPKWTRLPGQDQ